MKKVAFLTVFAMIATMGFAQEDKAVTEKLKQKYEDVSFQDYSSQKYYIVKQNGKYGVCDIKKFEEKYICRLYFLNFFPSEKNLVPKRVVLGNPTRIDGGGLKSYDHKYDRKQGEHP